MFLPGFDVGWCASGQERYGNRGEMANVPVARAEVEDDDASMLGLGGRIELDSRLKRPALAEAGIDGDSVGYDNAAGLVEYLNAQALFERRV
jgi:hypothetical protein